RRPPRHDTPPPPAPSPPIPPRFFLGVVAPPPFPPPPRFPRPPAKPPPAAVSGGGAGWLSAQPRALPMMDPAFLLTSSISPLFAILVLLRFLSNWSIGSRLRHWSSSSLGTYC